MRFDIKRFTALALCAALLAAAPLIASAGALNEQLFDDAKEALTLISYGEYQKALGKLNFSGEPPTAAEFEDFVCFDLDAALTQAVQTDVAVCFRRNKKFWLAIPVEEPTRRDVETLLLSSSDGERFDGYRAARWDDVNKWVGQDAKAVWNEPYDPGTLVVVPDE
jgi:hypothetical protein